MNNEIVNNVRSNLLKATEEIGNGVSHLLRAVDDDEYINKSMNNISEAENALKIAKTALNNAINPEGSDGHIETDSEGLPIEKKEETENDKIPEGLKDVFWLFKENFSSFSEDDFMKSYESDGIGGVLKYLVKVTGDEVKDLSISNGGVNEKIILLTTEGDVISKHGFEVKKCVEKMARAINHEVSHYRNFTDEDGNYNTYFHLKRKTTGLPFAIVSLASLLGLI